MKRHIVEYLKEQPELKGIYEVVGCSRIDQARTFFEDYMDDIHCIISDLNMNDEWLDKDFLKESYGGTLSGWVWLQHYVYTEKPNIPTIIYSGYIGLLKDCLKQKDELYKLNRDNIHTVNKGSGRGEGISGLLAELKKIIGDTENGTNES